jgi:hypothetical protein
VGRTDNAYCTLLFVWLSMYALCLRRSIAMESETMGTKDTIYILNFAVHNCYTEFMLQDTSKDGWFLRWVMFTCMCNKISAQYRCHRFIHTIIPLKFLCLFICYITTFYRFKLRCVKGRKAWNDFWIRSLWFSLSYPAKPYQ